MVAVSQSEIDFIAGQVVSETIEKQGNALIETVAGSELLKKVAKQYLNCGIDKTQGRMFEIIESTKFNAAAAKAGSLLRAVTTDQLGKPHAAADILIRDSNGDVLKQIQAKSYKKAATTARAVANAKYNDMDRLVNVENEDKVNELVEKRMHSKGIYAKDYRDAHGSIKGQTEYGDIKSGGTTYEESTRAAENPQKFATRMKQAEFISGAKTAILGGALAGAFVGGAVHASQGAFKGEFCVKETGKAAANSAARGAVISGASYGLKYLGRNNPIMSGNVVAALASSAVNITELTYKFLTGIISAEEYIQSLGKNAVSCFSGIVMTAAGAALFGPIGAAIAGTVALIGMKQIYHVFIKAQKDLKLADEALLKAQRLSGTLIQQIKEEEKLVSAYYQEYEATFVELRKVVNLAISNEGFTEQAIVSLAEGLHTTFQYNTLDDFEAFMLSEEELVL